MAKTIPAWTLLAACMLAPSTAEAASIITAPWRIGDEREVDDGIYFRLISSEQGWRLWRIETRDDIECRAVKSAVGKLHPIPLGVGALFYSGDPFIPYIVLYRAYTGTLSYSWKGRHLETKRVRFRKTGDRFWEDDNGRVAHQDGARLEVNVGSWEYPELMVGWNESRGVIDLSGWGEMARRVMDCHRDK